MGPTLKPVKVPSPDIPSLQHVDCTTQLDVFRKLAKSVLIPLSMLRKKKLKSHSQHQTLRKSTYHGSPLGHWAIDSSPLNATTQAILYLLSHPSVKSMLLQFRDNNIILASSTKPEISFMEHFSPTMDPSPSPALLPNSGPWAWDPECSHSRMTTRQCWRILLSQHQRKPHSLVRICSVFDILLQPILSLLVAWPSYCLCQVICARSQIPTTEQVQLESPFQTSCRVLQEFNTHYIFSEKEQSDKSGAQCLMIFEELCAKFTEAEESQDKYLLRNA